jgi:hypothetical protein
MCGPKPLMIELTGAQHQELEALLRRHSTPQQVALCTRLVVAAAEDLHSLNMQCSESLVQRVAELRGLDIDLGVKGEHGILRSMATRAGFLSEGRHKVVFHQTPKHSSRLNQVEICFHAEESRRSGGQDGASSLRSE